MARTAYLSNADLLAEIIACREVGRISDRLAKMLTLLVDRLALRPNFRHYTYVDEMKLEAMLMLCAGILKFNPEKSSSAFGYATTIAVNGMIRRLNLEKKQQSLRDDLLMDGYYTGGRYTPPSHTRMMDASDEAPVKRRPGRPRKQKG